MVLYFLAPSPHQHRKKKKGILLYISAQEPIFKLIHVTVKGKALSPVKVQDTCWKDMTLAQIRAFGQWVLWISVHARARSGWLYHQKWLVGLWVEWLVGLWVEQMTQRSTVDLLGGILLERQLSALAGVCEEQWKSMLTWNADGVVWGPSMWAPPPGTKIQLAREWHLDLQKNIECHV